MYSENIGIAVKIYIPSLPQLLVLGHCGKLENILSPLLFWEMVVSWHS